MSILSRWRGRFDGSGPAAADDPAPTSERYAFSAEIPAGALGSVCRIDLQLLSEPQRDGERLSLRAHLQTNFASVLRPALRRQAAAAAAPSAVSALPPAQPPDAARPVFAPVRRARQLAGRGMQRVLGTELAQRLAEPLLRHDVNTWVELQASTEPLDRGAETLVPQRERLAELGIRPSPRSRPGPVADAWASRTARGHAQLSLLQIDKRDLPAELVRRLGSRPFQLAAAIVNTVERK
jgi:hypothetical protein